MLKKTIRRLGALAMVLAMAVSVFAVNASAEGAEEQPATTTAITQIPFTKMIDHNEEAAYAPATSFVFTVTKATPGENETYGTTGAPVYEGVEGAVTITNPAAFSPDTGKSANGSINFIASKFTKPGIYKYTVKETDTGYDGMTYDTTERTLYVFVQNKTGGGYEVYGAELVKNGEKSDEFVNTYVTGTLTVGKDITGTGANLNGTYTIKVKIDGTEGEKYKATFKDSVTDLESGKQYEFTMGNGDRMTINGLSASDKCTVTEEEANTDGYNTTGQIENKPFSEITGATAIIVNNKENTAPTGVIMTIAPYALMVVLAGAFAVVFLTRRNRAE